MKLRYCPNCKQNVLPLIQARGGAGCVVFLACLVAGMAMTPIEPPTGVILGVGWWIGGFVAMMYMAHGRKSCPKCGTPARGLGKAL